MKYIKQLEDINEVNTEINKLENDKPYLFGFDEYSIKLGRKEEQTNINSENND